MFVPSCKYHWTRVCCNRYVISLLTAFLHRETIANSNCLFLGALVLILLILFSSSSSLSTITEASQELDPNLY